MIKRKLQLYGGSFYITLPHHLCDLLNITKGDSLEIGFEEGKIVIAPTPNANSESVQASRSIEVPA